MTPVYAIIMMTMLCGFVSLGVDYGRIQMPKGSMMAKSITLNDNDDLYYDEALASIPQSIGTGH